MKFFSTESEEVAKLKEIVNNYQRAFATQQKTLKSKKAKRAFIMQFLNHEFSCHRAIEQSLKQKRVHFRNFIKFLNILEISRTANLNDNANINTIWLEENDMKKKLEQLKCKIKSLKQKLYNIKDDLQHKRVLFEKLSRNFKITSKSTFMSSASENNNEENESMMLLSEFSEQRKRMRNWKIE